MVFEPFSSENGYRFWPLWSQSGVVFKGTTGGYERICLFNSKWIVKKEKNPKYIIWAEFYQFLTSLLMRSLIIELLRCNKGLKTGMDFRGQVWKRLWKMEIEIWGTGRHIQKQTKRCPKWKIYSDKHVFTSKKRTNCWACFSKLSRKAHESLYKKCQTRKQHASGRKWIDVVYFFVSRSMD